MNISINKRLIPEVKYYVYQKHYWKYSLNVSQRINIFRKTYHSTKYLMFGIKINY